MRRAEWYNAVESTLLSQADVPRRSIDRIAVEIPADVSKVWRVNVVATRCE